MPVVPRLSDSRVQTSPLPSARESVSATDETFGGGAASAATGAASKDLTTNAMKIASSAIDKANDLAVLNGAQQLSSTENALLYDPKHGAMMKQGSDAFGLPEQVLGDYDKAVQGIQKGLTNDAQRSAFQRQAMEHRISIDREVQKHVAAQIQVYDTETTKAYLTNEREAAALNYNDPMRVGLSLHRQSLALQSQQQRQGLPKEWLDQQLAEATSKTQRGIIERMLAVGDPGAADYADRAKSKLTSDDIALVDKAKTEAKQQQKLQQDELERQTVLGASDGKLTPDDLKTMLKSGQIDVAFYDKMNKRLTDVNNSDTIPMDQKAERYLQLVNAFKDLKNASVSDTTGKPETPAAGASLEQLSAFRQSVAGSAPYITKDQERAFYDYTQQNFDDARAGKVSGLNFLEQSLRLLGAMNPVILATAIGRYMGVFAKGVSVEQAHEKARALVQEQAQAQHPSLIGQKDLPNAVTSATATTRPIFDGSSTAKADLSLKPKTVRMRHPDGRLLNVPESLVKQAQAAGATLDTNAP